MTKETESAGAAQATAVAEADAVAAKQMQTNVVDVVETVQAAPVGGWNEKVEVANLVDPNSTNLPHPRSFSNPAGSRGAHLNVVGTDVPPQNAPTDEAPANGNVLDAGLVQQGEKTTAPKAAAKKSAK